MSGERKSVNAWVAKRPDGRLDVWFARRRKTDAIYAVTELYGQSWRSLYRETWRAVLDPDLALSLLERVKQGFELPLGVMLGTVKFGYPTTTVSLPGAPRGVDASQRFAWPLTAFKAFETPIACKGETGFWDFHGAEAAA